MIDKLLCDEEYDKYILKSANYYCYKSINEVRFEGVENVKVNIEKLKLSYSFFQEKAEKSIPFSLAELAKKTGWSTNTTRTYVGKKWKPFLSKEGQLYNVRPSEFMYSEEEYIRMMSQVQKYSSNPYKPDLDENVESLVDKAREAAILAIDIYNRPMTAFRTQGFTVMMIIAWTSLLHAIFEQTGVDYYYYDKDGVIKIVDGDEKAWELSKCVDECKELSHPVRENIRLFILLRNKIEHRFAPAFDLDICGECQALLLNFEELIAQRFGNYYSLSTTLSIPLQVITARAAWQYEISKKLQSKHYNELKDFIDGYRAELSDEVFGDNRYSFRVYLVPKTGNHRSSSDTAIEFLKYDPSHPEQFEDIEKDITLIKEKRVQVANQGRFKPTYVTEQVKQRLRKPFTITFHTKAWKYYKVRRQGYQPDGCNIKYCQYDEPHKDYVYTQEWIDYLVKMLSDNEEYFRVKSFR